MVRATRFALPGPHYNGGMDDPERLAAVVRDACVREALRAYEDAGLQGLCGEGRWEYAVQALRALDPGELATPAAPDPATDTHADPS